MSILADLPLKARLATQFPRVALNAIDENLKVVAESGTAREEEDVAKCCCEEVRNQNTTYGSLIRTMDLALEGGGCYKWSICIPFALLFVLCWLCCKFAAFCRG